VTQNWKPEILKYHIPRVAIEVTARRKTEIRTVLNKIEKAYSSSQVDSINIENYGNTQKVTAVVLTKSKKIEMTYRVDMRTKKVVFVQEVVIPQIIKSEFFSEETNKFGETTIVSNSVE
jgi:hypothetical protein